MPLIYLLLDVGDDLEFVPDLIRRGHVDKDFLDVLLDVSPRAHVQIGLVYRQPVLPAPGNPGVLGVNPPELAPHTRGAGHDLVQIGGQRLADFQIFPGQLVVPLFPFLVSGGRNPTPPKRADTVSVQVLAELCRQRVDLPLDGRGHQQLLPQLDSLRPGSFVRDTQVAGQPAQPEHN